MCSVVKDQTHSTNRQGQDRVSQWSLVPQSAATCPGNKNFFAISNAGSQLAHCEFGRHITANQSHTLLLPTCCRAPASIPRPTVSCQATCEVVHFPQGEAFPSFLLPVECGTKQKTLTPLVQPSEKLLPLLTLCWSSFALLDASVLPWKKQMEY